MNSRKIERKIIRDKEDGLDPQLADRMTLNQLYDKYIEQKYDLKQSTKVNYMYMYNHFVRPTFGKRFIGKIKYSDIKKFYYKMILNEEMKANTLDSIHTQLASGISDGCKRWIDPAESDRRCDEGN